MTKPANNDPAARTREWRERRRQQPGGLTQIITWVPKDYSEPLRKIFAWLGDPGSRGSACRNAVAHWLYRRRPAPSRMIGSDYTIEIDSPQIDNGSELISIGGRVFGPNGSFVELTPDEATNLRKELQRTVDITVRDFLLSHDIDQTLRDFTGVLPPEVAPHHAGGWPSDLKRYKVDRPESDEQFEAREAVLTSGIFNTHERVQSTQVKAGLFVLTYPGIQGLPSRCLAFLGSPGEPDRTVDNLSRVVALIALPGGGTPPTQVFERLGGVVCKTLVMDAAASPVRFFDVEPNDFSPTAALRIAEVVPGKTDQDPYKWVPNPRLPVGFNRNLREASESYSEWRRRLDPEETDAVSTIGRGATD